MSKAVAYVRSGIRQMAGYTPGRQPLPGSKVIKLNTNESPFPPSPAVAAAITEILQESSLLRRYPDPLSSALRRSAAALAGCRPEQVIAGNGSDELLRIVLDAFIEEGETAAFFTPSYSLYPVLIRIRGGVARSLPLFQKGELYQPRLDATKLFFLTSPNAPLGFSFSNDYIRKMAGVLNGILVVDEAYADFAQVNALPLLAELDNLVILRTFSKSYGLASLRVGLGFASSALIEQLDKVRDSYNIDRLAQAGARAALEDQEYLQASVTAVICERERLSHALQGLGFSVAPSQANFIFVTPPVVYPAAQMYADLEKAGILVRYFSDPQLSHGLRITIGTPDEMDQVIEVISGLLAAVGVRK